MRRKSFITKKFIRRAFRLFCFIFALIFSIQFVCLKLLNNRKKKELIELEQKLSDQKLKNEKIQEQLDSGFSDEYIENVARQELGMVKYSERVFIDIAKE